MSSSRSSLKRTRLKSIKRDDSMVGNSPVSSPPIKRPKTTPPPPEHNAQTIESRDKTQRPKHSANSQSTSENGKRSTRPRNTSRNANSIEKGENEPSKSTSIHCSQKGVGTNNVLGSQVHSDRHSVTVNCSMSTELQNSKSIKAKIRTVKLEGKPVSATPSLDREGSAVPKRGRLKQTTGETKTKMVANEEELNSPSKISNAHQIKKGNPKSKVHVTNEVLLEAAKNKAATQGTSEKGPKNVPNPNMRKKPAKNETKVRTDKLKCKTISATPSWDREGSAVLKRERLKQTTGETKTKMVANEDELLNMPSKISNAHQIKKGNPKSEVHITNEVLPEAAKKKAATQVTYEKGPKNVPNPNMRKRPAKNETKTAKKKAADNVTPENEVKNVPIPNMRKRPAKNETKTDQKKAADGVTSEKEAKNVPNPNIRKKPARNETKTDQRKAAENVPSEKEAKNVSKPKIRKRPAKKESKKLSTPNNIRNSADLPSPSKPLLKIDADDDSESDESDWEEVEDIHGNTESPEKKSQVPSETVIITLQGPDLMRKKTKKQFDMEAYIRRQINRAEREIQLEMHKVHLLCLLSHGFHRNRLCNDPELLALGLSVYPFNLINRDILFWDVSVMTKLARWFGDTFIMDPKLSVEYMNMKRTLAKRFASKTVASEQELMLLFLIILRSAGVVARLVYSLQPVSHKSAPKLKARKKKEDEDTLSKEAVHKTVPVKKAVSVSRQKPGTSSDNTLQCQRKAPSSKVKNSKRRSNSSKANYEEISDDETLRSKKSKTKGSSPETVSISSDSDFDIEETMFIKSPAVSKRKSGKGGKIVSSDSDDVQLTKVVTKKTGCDMWVEIYMERAEGWIPVDPVRCRINHPGELESRATQPVYYVLTYDNDNCIKDVTPRYSSNWMSTTRKLRVDNEWWDDVLSPYKPRDKARHVAEENRLQTQQLKKPLPTSVSQFKNHPLYALKRHLLKFEAIHPPDAVPVGFVKGEPVYSRENVFQVHTREGWLKEGRAVRVKEIAYKMVKARKKKSKISYETPQNEEDVMAECFGIWQTEQYMPAPVFNGKIPRNQYGNLELYKPWMLPIGAVHLRLPGLNRIANKMKMDCVPAMVGWDSHCGFSHPVLEGFIVCEEHKDILIAAWDEQQEIDKEREQEKREKRVLANWRLLTRCLLIKERMKIRFDLQEPRNLTGEKNDKTGGSDVQEHTTATDRALAWPMNRQDETKQLSTDKDKNLFPTEEL